MEEIISKERIQDLAGKLLIKLDDEGCKRLQDEFRIIIKHMDIIEKMENINEVKPLPYPFVVPVSLRDDVILENRTHEEILANCKDILNNEIKVPKVVGE